MPQPAAEAGTRILYRARCLVPMAGPPLDNGGLLVADGTLAAVGPFTQLAAAGRHQHSVDLGEVVVLPPLANAHTHLELTHYPRWSAIDTPFRGDFTDWLLHLVGVLRDIPPQDFAPSLVDGLQTLLRFGTGAVGDVLSRLSARNAYRGTPLAGRVFLEVLGVFDDLLKRRLNQLRPVLNRRPAAGLDYGLTPHAPYTLTQKGLGRCLELARHHRLPVSMHLAESPAEVQLLDTGDGPLAERFYPAVGWREKVPAATGLSPVAWLAAAEPLPPGMLLVHGVQVGPEDIPLLAGHRATVVLCPRSNEQLGVGTAPVADYLAAGVPLALGTDSLASSGSLSLWDEMAAARRLYGNCLAPPQLLHLATRDGARALGLEGRMGILQAGWGAHFQVLRPDCQPAPGELFEYLCSPKLPEEIQALYLDGREVLHSG